VHCRRCGPARGLRFSDTGGITQFGAFVECLPPGSRSSLCHWHLREDEFVYMLEGEVTPSQAKEQAIAATRQLAKRQLTWLRSLPDRLSVEANSHKSTEKTLAIVGRLIDDRTIVD
jgi:hypothetical protein